MESPVPPLKHNPDFPVHSPNTPIQYDHRQVQTTPRQGDICFRCGQVGHWSRDCDLNNKSRSRISQNSNFPKIYCRCGHGFCEVRTTKNRDPPRSYYVCPIKRGKKCEEYIKCCDPCIDENNLPPPPYKYPLCSCGAGVCRRVKAASGPYKGRFFFACPIKRGHGACSYCLWEDTLTLIPNIEDLLDTDITPNFGDLLDIDMDVDMDLDIDTDIAPNIDDPQGADIAPDMDAPQDADIPDVDNSQDIDETFSRSWDSLMEKAHSMVHRLKPSTIHDLSPENHAQHHEEEKVSLTNIPADNFVKPENSYVEAQAEFETSQQHIQSLREEASRLKILLQQVEGEIISCELLTKEMEARLGEIQA